MGRSVTGVLVEEQVMIFKAFKLGLLTVAGVALVGGVVFGRELCSYVSSSARSVRHAVKDAVPVEFELRRARDLVDDIVPEMQANVRLIAQQEVEIESLRRDIDQSRRGIDVERAKVVKLRDALATSQTSFSFGRFHYTRDQLKEDLARRFDTLKEAEVVISGKERLLINRERSLQAAVQTLERTRQQKSLLESQIAALEGQNQLVKAAAVGSGFQVDNTKLAQTERLIGEIRKQLDVAERVLAHEARFVEPIQVDTVSEKDLLTQIDEHFNGSSDDGSGQIAKAQR
jgi:hypothetical protein